MVVRVRRCMLLSKWSASAWEMWTGLLFLLSQESGSGHQTSMCSPGSFGGSARREWLPTVTPVNLQ